MPVIKSAKKKLRQDKKATVRNAKQETALKDAIKAAKKSPSIKTIGKATSLADKAAKRFIIHKNKAARLKSALSKLMGGGKGGSKAEKAESKPTKKAVTKKVTKPAKKAAAKKK